MRRAPNPLDELSPGVRYVNNGLEYNLPRMAEFAIDQAVVDGVVKGTDPRAPLKILRSIAFAGRRVPAGLAAEFVTSLTEDRRFIDCVDSSFGYQPDGTEIEKVQPTLIAIVKGTAVGCSEERRASVLRDMNILANVVFHEAQTSKEPTVMLRPRYIRKLLESKGLYLDKIQKEAFLHYLNQDPRFYRG